MRSLIVDPIEIADAHRVRFDPDRHLYFVDGVWRPNVTTVLDAMGMQGDTSRFTQYDRDVGTETHSACALYVRGRLDVEDADAMDPAVRPKLNGFVSWLERTGFIVRASELRLWSAYGYAGTGDLFGHYPGEPWITAVDFKGSWNPPAVGLQLAAYAHAFTERTGLVVRRRISLNLYSDHRAVPRECGHADDFAVFRSALNVYGWKVQRGLIELPAGVDVAA